MEHIVVTGSNGFIGRHLTKTLSDQGHDVIGLPRNLLYDPRQLYYFIQKVKPTQVYHLAAYGNKHDQSEKDLIIGANVVGTYNLLQATNNIAYQAFINFGSSSEYGKKDRPMKEEDLPEPSTVYGSSKVVGTFLSGLFACAYGKPIVTVRPFSIYGPEDDPRHFIPTAIRCFKYGEQLNLAPGVHDWVYIDDFIEGILLVAKNVGELSGRAVNIGTGTQFTNDEVVELLSKISGMPGNINRVGKLRDYDTIKSWVADNSLLKSLGWGPKIDLKTGLDRTYHEK